MSTTPAYSTLIEPGELAALTEDPQCAIVDCRFDLGRPSWGEEAYAQAHVPQAVYAHLDRDLSGPVTGETGRHPLPSLERFAEALSHWGIDDTVQVVAYDQGPGAYAARLWWMLRWAGHDRVAVLNGGFAAWQRAGLPVASGLVTRSPRRFRAKPARTGVVTTVELQRALASGEIELVDARGADRFAGQNETIDPVAGHVPGARNHPFTSNVDSEGRFLPKEALRESWARTLGDKPAAQVVAMCGSGVTACHNLLALETAGLPGARLYGGSWSEWIRDPQRPVARGSD